VCFRVPCVVRRLPWGEPEEELLQEKLSLGGGDREERNVEACRGEHRTAGEVLEDAFP